MNFGLYFYSPKPTKEKGGKEISGDRLGLSILG
jgi:hypothetical protein